MYVHLYLFLACVIQIEVSFGSVCVYVCVYVYMLTCIETKIVHMNFYFVILNKVLCITKECDTLVNLNENFHSNMLIFVVYQEV